MNDLLDVVPSAKFLKEFPSGKIPIRDTARLESHLANVEDLVVALKRMIRYHDETSALLKNLSAEQVFVEIDKYSLLPVHNFTERRAVRQFDAAVKGTGQDITKRAVQFVLASV